MLASCAAKKSEPAPEIVAAPRGMEIGGVNIPEPKAVAFQTNGDYANHVTMYVSPSGDGKVIGYPDPRDARGMAPVAVCGGWYISRLGINQNCVFLRWTWEEYASLKQVPSRAELEAAIIPDAKVTAITTLPFTLTEFDANPAIAAKILCPQD